MIKYNSINIFKEYIYIIPNAKELFDMCGICGFTGQVTDRDSVIKSMTEVITHRGPDSDGFFTDEHIAMGFRRLSIIDLSQGHQPIYNEDKTLVLTFNGEIYNYKALRRELVSKGHSFRTDSDSEVLVHGFEEWQEDLLPRLRGMFGFAIYNTVDNSIFIARDFFGIKPMHYCQIGEDFVYASEIKSILEHPNFVKRFNRKALDTYLSFQYAVPPETFFEGVYCLMPGHYLWYKDGEVETTRYWEARFNPDEDLSEEEAVDRIEKVFENSVNAHKIADVEVGCFLSSGVDSSYVSTYFADQKTFTVGFDFGEKYNEISWAKGLSEKIGVEHHTHLISSEEFWDAVPTVQYHMDQPLADPSCIALYFVSRLASHFVKVVLSGEGADELFGGYTCYNDPRVFKMYQKIVPHFLRKAIRAICRKLPDIKGRDYLIRACDPLEQRYIGNAFMYDYNDKKAMLKDPSIATPPQDYTRKYYYRCRKYDDVTKMQYLDINMWMVGDILLKADRMSMANSLELRVPFLDKEVFKVASTLPTRLRCNKHNTKYAMRKAAVRHMPEETAEKEKLGFPVPTRVWLRDEKYYNIVKKKFTGKTAEKFFNTEPLVAWLDEHFTGKEDNSRKIWTVYVFLVWYDIYFDETSKKVEKPINHLDELKAVAEARREKQINAPGEVIMAAAEAIDKEYDAPDFGVDKSGSLPEKSENEAANEAEPENPVAKEETQDEAVPAEAALKESIQEKAPQEEVAPTEAALKESVREKAPQAENTQAENAVEENAREEAVQKEAAADDGSEPAIVESEDESEQPHETKPEEYVNISNPEDKEIYDAPKKPRTPQEQMQMTLEGIEKRSKYLDEPNVISDDAVDSIVSSLHLFDDDDDID